MPLDLIADQHEIRNDYTSLPIGANTREFLNLTNELYGKMMSIIDTIRGVEDDLHPFRPLEKINRVNLLEATTSPESIQQSYDLYKSLEQLSDSAPIIRIRIQQLMGIMNNYDPYVNIRGVLARKNELLKCYANGENASREQRFAICVAQVMDILRLQKEREFDAKEMDHPKSTKNERKKAEKMKEGYKYANTIGATFLQTSEANEAFQKMGFSLGETLDDYQHPEGYPPLARVTSLSGKDREVAFITIHQVFETYFEEALAILRKISLCKDESEVNARDIQDVTLLLTTSNEYFKVMRNLLDREQFNAMRSSFGIASGAQSQQYHLMENYIGYPGDENHRNMRFAGLTHLLGERNVAAIKEEIPPENSLKERFGTSERLRADLRTLNLALLEFKAIHGNTMLVYLPADVPGSGGTMITHFFSKGMGTVFPEPVFSSEETDALAIAAGKGEQRRNRQDTDGFQAVLAFIKEARKACPKEGHC